MTPATARWSPLPGHLTPLRSRLSGQVDGRRAGRSAEARTARSAGWLVVGLLVACMLAGVPPALAQAGVDPGAADPADPYKSLPWVDMRREYLGAGARTVFDDRVKVVGPAFAEDPM
ncbi:MAG: hypothetical protein RL375_2113, partial [Pseudomonadota bacterium]